MVAAGGHDDDPAVVEYARYLGIQPHEDAALMHIAREAVVAELPHGWEEHTEDDGNPFFFNEKEDRSTWEHPCDAHYRDLVVQTRQAVVRPSFAMPGAQDASLEFSASPATSAVALQSPVPVKAALLQPSTEVKARQPTVDPADAKHFDAIASLEARSWWAERIGRKRVRTRQVAKLLAVWLVEHHTVAPVDNPLSDADEVVANSSTARECARTIATAMEKEEGRVSAEDFGAFVADSLHGNFSPAALRSLARKLHPLRTAGSKRRQQVSQREGQREGQRETEGQRNRGMTGSSVGQRAFEVSRDTRASAVRHTRTAKSASLSWPTCIVLLLVWCVVRVIDSLTHLRACRLRFSHPR